MELGSELKITADIVTGSEWVNYRKKCPKYSNEVGTLFIED